MKKILVADDSGTIRRLFQIVFRKMGKEVDFAEDGESCLIKIKEIEPDILFLDANMPGKSGWEILDYVKKEYPDMYVILMTADEKGDSPQRPNMFLKKPFSIDDVIDVIKSIS